MGRKVGPPTPVASGAEMLVDADTQSDQVVGRTLLPIKILTTEPGAKVPQAGSWASCYGSLGPWVACGGYTTSEDERSLSMQGRSHRTGK